MAMEEDQPSVWRVGILLEASCLPQLRNNPMKLISPVVAPGGGHHGGVVAVCKQGLLNTYQYVNEYITPNQNGCLLHAVDHTSCQFPAVLAAPLSDQLVDFEEVFKQLSVDILDVQVATGFPQPTEPTIILASQHFMECYGFFTREPIWFRWYNPATLDDVMLVPVGPHSQRVLTQARNVVSQLYKKIENESIVMQQGFKFIFRTELNFESGSEATNSTQEAVLNFQILECSPVLQGRVTKDTVITLLPPSNILALENQMSRRRRSTREDGRVHAESAASASDLGLLKERNSGTEGYVIEATSVASFKLQSQYVVLPKETAIKQGIYHCQNVMIEAAGIANKRSSVSSLSDVTVPIFVSNDGDKEPGKRTHMAIALLYEDECELEHYVPPVSLGMDYDTTTLTVAYIHPQLLFFLFPETLSLSARYHLLIKVSDQCVNVSAITIAFHREQRLHYQL